MLKPTKWNAPAFRQLMTSVRMPKEYGATYPKDGDTAATPLPDLLLSSPISSVLAISLTEIEPTVEHFRRFYQLQAQLGFYSFSLRTYVFKIFSNPPKGFTQWKLKFFYVKEVAVAYEQHFRSVFVNIPKEKITVPAFGAQEWFQALQSVPMVTLSNRELQFLRMMLRSKSGVKTKLLYKEKGQVVHFWRSFAEDSELKIAIEDCAEGEEGWYETTFASFWVPTPAALNAPCRKA
ncbi:hypothetical protein Hanom_Chr06g00512891 [Helianthus anomalus]